MLLFHFFKVFFKILGQVYANEISATRQYHIEYMPSCLSIISDQVKVISGNIKPLGILRGIESNNCSFYILELEDRLIRGSIFFYR